MAKGKLQILMFQGEILAKSKHQSKYMLARLALDEDLLYSLPTYTS